MDQPHPELAADCTRCFGLCCIALGFTRADGFGHDKPAGVPCQYLDATCRCAIHPKLEALGYEGCKAFDCLGAGQIASAQFAAQNWQKDPAIATKLHARFGALLKIQELRAAIEEAGEMMQSNAQDAERISLLLDLEHQANNPLNENQSVVHRAQKFIENLR